MKFYVLALGLAATFSASASSPLTDSSSTIYESILRSSTCGGSCTAILRTDSQIYLQIRDPQTGELYKLIPLDFDRSVVFGSFSSKDNGKSQAKFGGDPGGLPDKTGVIVEQGPFSDNSGDGMVYVYYTYVNGKLTDVQVVKIYVHKKAA